MRLSGQWGEAAWLLPLASGNLNKLLNFSAEQHLINKMNNSASSLDHYED